VRAVVVAGVDVVDAGCDRANAKNFSGIRAILPWIVS